MSLTQIKQFIIQLHSVENNNTNNEYKCLMVFVLQQTSLTGFNLQTSHVAENASLSEENNEIVAKV